MGQRPTLPQLKLKYHWRVFVSRPSSEWDRVVPKSYNHPIIYQNKNLFNISKKQIVCLIRLNIHIVKKSIRLLVFVSFTPRSASTPNLSTWSSTTILIGIPCFEGGFPLRCIQRLSRPYLATQQCPWQDNWYTRGMFISVLSY